MLNLSVLHKAPVEALPAIVATGLRRAESNELTPAELRANRYLDQCRPPELVERGPRRRECVYCYLGIDDRVLDVNSGELVRQAWWWVGPHAVRLRLTTRPEQAFISDLDAYDQVLAALEHDPHHRRLPELARRYWCRVLDLNTVREHYQVAGQAIVATPSCPGHLPRELRRVEVLLTSDIGPEDIQTTTGRALVS